VYVGYREKKAERKKKKMEKTKMGNNVKFERIRRITGYLVGTLDKWNNAKKAEEKDRVKHNAKKDL
jgi:ribonucleoside-triphosphate reductase